MVKVSSNSVVILLSSESRSNNFSSAGCNIEPIKSREPG